MLEVHSLCRQYGSLRSVSDVSFTIGDGEVVGLLGRNGAGKSTLMRMLSGYLTPSSGNIRLWGHDMLEDPICAKRCVGYLPELPPLYTDMTVNEQLQFVCALRGIPARSVKKECERVCSELNISHVSGRVTAHLSKGYRQRVGFAAALIGEPKLLILDEPTVGLDPQQMLEIRRLITSLSGRMSVLISSHVLTEISAVCTRLLIIKKGVLIEDGAPEDLMRRYGGQGGVSVLLSGDADTARRALLTFGLPIRETEEDGGRTRLTLTSDTDAGSVYRALQSCPDVLVSELRSLQPSLEDIFLELTREGETNDERSHP